MAGFFTRTKGDMKYLFKNKQDLSKKERRRKRRGWSTIIGIVLVLIQLVMTVLFLLKLYKLDMLPLKYIIMVDIILVLIALYNFTSQFTKAHIFGKVLSVLMAGILTFTFLFASKLDATLSSITNTITQTDVINVVVLKDDKASSISDALSYTFGYNKSVNETNIKKAIEDINSDNNKTIATKEYTEWSDVISALYSGTEIKAMIFNNSMYTTLNEQFTDFKEKTKVIGTVEITTKIKVEQGEKKVNGEPFILYISGNDGEGEIASQGHSDVNILVCVNPKTRQVLLISTPRDSYVKMHNADGREGLDKLTHAGNPGIEYSIDAIENLYGINIDYYMKINFTGCIEVVDALGGITINSSVEFHNGYEAYDKTFYYNIGPNECNGEQTLAFVRERKAFGAGDFQRGKNQQAAITGIINKITSPSILANYGPLLDSLNKVVVTNMSTETISSLVKAQLSDSRAWNVQSYSIEGTTGSRNGQVYDVYGMSVVLPYSDSINLAIQLMSKVQNGDVFDVDEYVEQSKAEASSSASN